MTYGSKALRVQLVMHVPADAFQASPAVQVHLVLSVVSSATVPVAVPQSVGWHYLDAYTQARGELQRHLSELVGSMVVAPGIFVQSALQVAVVVSQTRLLRQTHFV